LRVVTYDIESNRDRARAARYLEGIGERVQKSVFEARLDEEGVRRVLNALEPLLDAAGSESVRIYTVCESCRRTSRARGAAPAHLPASRSTIA